MFDLERRMPVWQALSRLFVEEDLTDEEICAIAQVLKRSQYSRSELSAIYEEEVAPVCYANLFDVRGQVDQIDPKWLEEAILDHRNRQHSVPGWWPFGKMPGKLGVEITRNAWHEVMGVLRRLRRDPVELADTIDQCHDVATLVRSLEDLALQGDQARPARPALLSALAHHDFRVRTAAIEAVAKVLGDEAIDQVITHLSDESPSVKTAAVTALHNVVAAIVEPLPDGADGSLVPTRSDRLLRKVADKALDAVLDHLKYGKSGDRLHAARLIELLGAHAQSAVPTLFNAFDDRNEAVRRAVADAVVATSCEPEETLGKLKSALFDGSPRVRQTAALCLAMFVAGGDRRYYPAMKALRSALEDDSSQVRRGAAAAIGWMGPTAADAVPKLAELVGAPEPATRSAALFALGRMQDAALDELPVMAAALHDDHPEVRRAALRAFQHLGSLVQPLETQFERMLADPDWLTQFEARRTLETLRGEEVPQRSSYWSGLR